MSNLKQQLIDYLLINGKDQKWNKIYEIFPFLGDTLTSKQKSDSVRCLYRTLMKAKPTETWVARAERKEVKNLKKMLVDISSKKDVKDGLGNHWIDTEEKRHEESFKKDKKDGLVLKSTWQNAAGTWLESYTIQKDGKKEQVINHQEVIDNLIYSVPELKIKKQKSTNTTKMISITDIHLGMSSEGNIFNKEWCLKEYYRRLDTVAEEVEPGEDVVLTILGDFTDGFQGKTNRGGHKLPQNLNDKEMFEEGLKSLLYLSDQLVAKASTVRVYFLTNSNHPGVTDHNISVAMENISSARYSNFTWVTCTEFITPITVSGVDYLLTHGYDEALMMRGLPRFYADKEISKLRNIIDYYKLNKPTILRGDLHQFTHVDYDFFQDIIVPAFSSPSGWISINFFSQNNGGFLTATYEDKVPRYMFRKF